MDDIYLPEDVLIGILVLLPVVSLLRFKSVCKPWLLLIERPDFVHLHSTTLENEKSTKLGTFIFQTRLEPFHISWSYRPHFFVLSGADDFEKVEDLGVPPYFNNQLEPPRPVSMVGSCDGIVCIHDSHRRDVALWNPATKQFRLLPKWLNFRERGCFIRDFAGFGFDSKRRDYKVLLVTELKPECHPWGTECMRQAQVYSLSSDSWRHVDIDLDIRCDELSPHNQGRYLNGIYYLLGFLHEQKSNTSEDVATYVVLSFNFVDEKFRIIRFPDGIIEVILSVNQLNVFRNKLSFLEDTGKDVYKDSLIEWNLWVLNDCHGKESWTKLFKVELLPYLYSMYGPLAFSKNGEIGFVMRDFLQLYNVVTQETKDCQWEASVRVLKADIFKWSLVSISGNRSAATTS